MEKVSVAVFGRKIVIRSGEGGGCCGTAAECQTRSHKEEAEGLFNYLRDRFDSRVEFSFKFFDIFDPEMKQFPEIQELIPKLRLPITLINNKPSFHGGLDKDTISRAVQNTIGTSE